MTLIGIYGASGFGREILPIARSNAESGVEFAFIDDAVSELQVNGYPVFNWDGFLQSPATTKSVVLAIANSVARETLALKCIEAGINFFDVRALNAVVLDNVLIGSGVIIAPFVTLTSNIRIGRLFHANIYSYVAHDCIIGDFVTFAPGVKCNGNVVIEDHAYIGTGAILKQGRPGKPLVIGRGAVVGMGAVVTKDVPAGVTVVGNPARPLVKD